MARLKLGCLVACLLVVATAASAQQQRPAGLIGAALIGQGAAVGNSTGGAPQASLSLSQQFAVPPSVQGFNLLQILNLVQFGSTTPGQRVSLH
jgi:hypothetical protein